MSDQNEGWDTIEVPSKEEENKIEFEVEGEEEVLEAVEEKPKEEAAPQKEELKEARKSNCSSGTDGYCICRTTGSTTGSNCFVYRRS